MLQWYSVPYKIQVAYLTVTCIQMTCPYIRHEKQNYKPVDHVGSQIPTYRVAYRKTRVHYHMESIERETSSLTQI